MTDDEFQGRVLRELGQLNAKVDGLSNAVEHIANAQIDDAQRVDRHGRRMRRMEQQLALVSSAPPMAAIPDWQPEMHEITGTFELRQLQEERADRRSEAKHLRRKRIDWTISAIGALLLVALTALITKLLGK